MHWILQSNLIHPVVLNKLVGVLEAQSVAYSLSRLIPFFHLLDGPAPAPEGPVFVYGSTGFGEVAKIQGWRPGYFDANLDYELMLQQYGHLALNAGAVCDTLGAMPQHFDEFFLRPTLDNKSFAGTVMTWDEFDVFRQGVASVADEQDVTLRLTDRIVTAPLTKILAEYRFFVIAGKVVTGSRYKVGDKVESSADVPAEIQQFAQDCVTTWSPNPAFTIDIAETPDGLKVIELNSANSAGFYACDIAAIVAAVNERLT